MEGIENMMEDENSGVSGSNERPTSVDNAAESDECVNSMQSADQGPHNVNYEHTTHLHTERTADFVENVFVSKFMDAQTHSGNEDIVLFSGNIELSEHTSEVESENIAESIERENESNSEIQFTFDDNTLSKISEFEEPAKEKFDVETLSYELQVGYKILLNLMGAGNRFVNKLFLYPVDDSFPETAEYYSKIKEPIWMMKMKEKFESCAYSNLTEFMADFKLMIENCYRFNGPDNFVSKKAQKLETMMKQKIALLSKDLREKLMGSVSTDDDILTSAGIRRRVRNPNAPPEDESQVLLMQLRRDKAIRDREDRRQRSDDRKALEAARIQEIQQWEDQFLGEDVKDCLNTMWELPQIGLFVYLCMECLGLDEEVTQYQLERGLVAPQECSDFRRLMTCLLSTQHQRKSVKTFMPYTVWNKKLSQKLDYFYKMLSDCGGNHQQACYKLGFDNRAFKVIGKSNPLLKKQFHQLSFLKRVWILKSYCDHCVEIQSYLQKTIEEAEAERPMDVREVLLGSDGRGNRYINFPMFTGKDIRIYRYPKLQEPSLSSLGLEDWSLVEEKPSASSSRCSTPVNQRFGRYSESQASSLRARAILQAAESNDPSPVRDLVRSSPDLHDDNSNSNQGASSVSSETLDTSKGKTRGPYKKRKKSGFLGKRKRLKTGGRREPDLDEYADSPGTERDEEGSVKGEENEDSQGFNVPKFNANQNGDCDMNASNGFRVDSKKTPAASYGQAVNQTSSQSVSASSSISTSTNYAKLANGELEPVPGEGNCDGDGVSDTNNKSKVGVKENKEKNGRGRPKDVQEQENEPFSKSENTDSCVSDNVNSSKSVTNQDSAYLSCDSDKSSHKEGDSSVNLSKDEIDSVELSKMNSEDKPDGDRKDNVKEENMEEVKSETMMECDDVDKREVKNENMEDTKTNVLSSIKEETEMLTDAEVEKGENGEQPEVKTEADVKEEVIEEEESDDEDLPDLGRIELVAESMEEIRTLMNKLSNPDPIKRGKRVYPGVMKPCEEELLANLTRFHDELLKYERSLFNARVHAQVKLRKEVESYCEPKAEETKGWESETSQSSKESSDVEDNESRKDNGSKPPKKSKSKSSTTELLSSAASKLMSLNGETNEDSNDSYELDISSRGRLRKRRVIPNNTEDTGLKKRKNLEQEFLSSTSSSTPSSTASVITSPLSTNANIGSLNQHESGRTLPSQILSMLASSTSPSNAAVRSHLTSSNKPMPCQIVRLVSPRGDATAYKAVRLAGKPNVLLSPEKFANVQFISSSGIVTIPRNKLLASATQSSHPVIQNLLKNQAKSGPGHVYLQNSPVKGASVSDINKQGQLLTKTLSLNQPSNTIKGTSAATNGQAAANANNSGKPPFKMVSRATSAVVVTQVSNSFISQGGKQVLDLGSLSVTQIQQLVKNQAIQINTGAGNPTTLLLTTGLQQLSTSKAGAGSAASTTLATSAVGSSSQVKVPVQTVFQAHVKANSVPGKNPSGQMMVIPKSNSSQLPVIRTIINRPALNNTVRTICSTVGSPNVIAPNSQQTGALSHGTLTVVQGATALKQIPSPRIISSLNQNSFITSQGPNVANKENPISVSINSISSNSKSSVNDAQKANWVSIPMPQKKYAGNVTVKALLENRSVKKCDGDPAVGQDEDGEGDDASKHSVKETNNSEQAAVSNTEEILNSSAHAQIQSMSASVVTESDALSSSTSSGSNINISVREVQGSSVPVTQPLSVDAAIQPLMFSSVQVSLPTVNMKVPSPNTLPSMTHNKHSTTIVQSTKVPIPVASTVDSHSPITQPSIGLDNTVSSALVIPSSSISVCNPSTIISKPQATCVTSPGNQATINVNSNNVANLKNVMLKLTPPKGGSGQFVQGYMTSQGKLVIPQTALFPQQQQQQQQPQTGQVLQAGPNRVILANTSQALTLQPGQVQAKPPAIIGGNNGSAQTKIFQQTNQNQTVHVVGQPNNQLVIANAQQSNSLSANVSARAVPVQSGNAGIKLMLINPSAVPGLQNVQQPGVVQSAVTANVFSSQPQAIQTSTPASELVKQIASSSQLHAAAVQQQGTTSTSKAVQVMSQSVQPNTSQVVQTITAQGTPGVSQLAAQILALQQQGNKTVQFQQAGQQQIQGGIVLAKPAALQQTQQGAQSGAISVQLQQLNQMLSPAVRGVTQVQVQNSQLQQGVQGTLTAAKPVQQAQMVQLALNPQNANARGVIAQPAARVVQVASQLSPQIQLANQNPMQSVNPVPQQVGLIIQQQPTVLQPTQQLIRTPGSNMVQLQQNNTAVQQQKPLQASAIQQPKPAQIVNNPQVRQQLGLSVSGNQPQIQFVINPSASSSLTTNSTANINLTRFTNPVIHPVIRAVATSTLCAPSSSTTHLTGPHNVVTSLTSSSLQNIPAAASGKQIHQLGSQSLATSNQLIISPIKLPPQSPIKLTPQSPQARLVSPIRVVNPMQTILQPGSLTDQKANQLVIQNTTQLHNVLQSNKPLPQASQQPRPSHAPLAGTMPGDKGKITNVLLGQPGVKQQVVSIMPGGNSIAQVLSKPVTPVGNSNISGIVAGRNVGSSHQQLVQQGTLLSVNGDMSAKMSGASQQIAQESNQFSQVVPGSNSNTHQSSQQPAVGSNQNGIGKVLQNQPGHTVSNGITDSTPSSSKQTSNRRNTFGGSQEMPKLLTRHASVEESVNQSMTSEERDEKEAALNLLTLANQPL